MSEFRMKARNFSENKEGKLVPGPGAYSPYINPVAKKDPSFKMPKAERGDVNQSRLSWESVAPGAYEPNNMFTRKKDPQWRFS